MNLREWISNSPKKNGDLQSEDRLKDKVLKVLVIVWNIVTDDIQISTKQINNMQPAATKREALTATNRKKLESRMRICQMMKSNVGKK